MRWRWPEPHWVVRVINSLEWLSQEGSSSWTRVTLKFQSPARTLTIRTESPRSLGLRAGARVTSRCKHSLAQFVFHIFSLSQRRARAGARIRVYFAMQTFLGSVKKRRASSPPSRPTPLCFMPPKGTRRSRTSQQFTQTVPVLIRSATRWARLRF